MLFKRVLHVVKKFLRMADDTLFFPHCERNKQPILEVFKEVFPQNEKSFLIEIASGSGQHATFFSTNFPNVTWQPTEVDEKCLKSIQGYIKQCTIPNLRSPVKVDVTANPENWFSDPVQNVDFMYVANLVHISPWKVTQGLFKAAGHFLKPTGQLMIYGPFAFHGSLTPESNVRFDESLKQRNPEWGIRDIDDLKKESEINGLSLIKTVPLPSNNHILVYQKS